MFTIVICIKIGNNLQKIIFNQLTRCAAIILMFPKSSVVFENKVFAEKAFLIASLFDDKKLADYRRKRNESKKVRLCKFAGKRKIQICRFKT